MTARTYYYASVSSASQSLARQIEAFHNDGADDHDIITEKKSGKDMDRPEYQVMKQHMLRPGDTLVVMSLDRLGRNKQAIKDELGYYRKNNIRVRILDIPTSNFEPEKGQRNGFAEHRGYSKEIQTQTNSIEETLGLLGVKLPEGL